MLNRIAGTCIMVNVLSSSVVDLGFEPRVVYLVLVFSLMVGCSQTDILRQSGIWGYPVTGLLYIRSLVKIREGSRHTFSFRVEIITNLTILFVSLYFKVPQRYEMVENN